jgi:hypothetical protein
MTVPKNIVTGTFAPVTNDKMSRSIFPVFSEGWLGTQNPDHPGPWMSQWEHPSKLGGIL